MLKSSSFSLPKLSPDFCKGISKYSQCRWGLALKQVCFYSSVFINTSKGLEVISISFNPHEEDHQIF